MCGIACSISMHSNSKLHAVEQVGKINNYQRRRGPDNEGLYISNDGKVVLGHRRLSIIDLTSKSDQPLTDHTQRWAITFNGELYNFEELRDELKAIGYLFLTDSDTEVIINSFDKWGVRAFSKFVGMYAFILYDNFEKRAWVARDPFGIKPLYFVRKDDQLFFASQSRALREVITASQSINLAAKLGYHIWGFVPEPFVWWEGINVVPAGSVFSIDTRDLEIKDVASFSVEKLRSEPSSTAKYELKDLRAEIQSSVRRHYVSDVPVAVLLSGGVDSSVIAESVAAQGLPLNTINIAFEDFINTPYDETAIAEKIANVLGSNHKTIRIRHEEILSLVDDFMENMDQPTYDGLNTFIATRACSQYGFKVALSGMGGDELFGGYPTFVDIPRILKFRKLPFSGWLDSALRNFGGSLPRRLMGSTKIDYLWRYSNSIDKAYMVRRCLQVPEEASSFFQSDDYEAAKEAMLKKLPNFTYFCNRDNLDLTDHAAISELELTNFLRCQLLRDSDWASMANSVELRTPFLDIRLFSYLSPLINSPFPPTKNDLREISARISWLVPTAKHGFSTPGLNWNENRKKKGFGSKTFSEYVAKRFEDSF